MHDSRIRYFRADTNRGLAWNWNRAFELATGRYLVWFSHDDLMAPDYIRQCVEVLQQDADTLLCFTNSYYIDGEGKVIQRVDLLNPGAAETPSERFQHILYDVRCDPVCGLMKTEFLKQTRLHAGYADSVPSAAGGDGLSRPVPKDPGLSLLKADARSSDYNPVQQSLGQNAHFRSEESREGGLSLVA